MKTKAKSAIIFTLIVIMIGVLAYAGIFGISVAGYSVKPFSESISRGLDLQGGVSVLEQIQDTVADQATINRTIELLSMRVNKMGVSETTVSQEGSNRIRIDIPGTFNAQEVLDTVGKTGELTFVGPDGTVILTGKDVEKASAYLDTSNGNSPTISLELNSSGTTKFAAATKKYLDQQIAIFMDDQLLTNPTVEAVITNGQAVITGSSSLKEAQTTADIINSGALPVTLKPVEVQTIGASLGATALPLSVTAGEVGIGIVLILMILYYRIPGIIADVALVLYMLLVLYAFALLQVTLTLSGIAAFLLTVGMAVDANILIFERTKEELKSGKSIKSAIDAGFHRAMTSILDSNLTSILTGIVLYSFGTGEVKGFALTLIVGVAISMFTAVTFSRYLVKLAANMGWFNKKWSIGTFGVHDFRRGGK